MPNQLPIIGVIVCIKAASELMENILPNQIDTDYKAAVVAAELLEQGLAAPDNLVILPAGPQQRAYSKEIRDITTYRSAYRNRQMVSINVNQEGLYDMLPEGLFHEPPASSVTLTEEAMIKDIVQRREEEKQARQFFAPFEAEINHLRTIVALYESRLDKKSHYNDLINIFLKEWQEFKCFTKEQMIVFLQVLPLIHEQRNQLGFISGILTVMFKADITLTYQQAAVTLPPELLEQLDTRIGAGQLGVDFVAGRAQEQEEVLQLTIGPLSARYMIEFLPGSRTAMALQTLLGYFVPLQTTVNTQYLISKSDQLLDLGNETSNSCLGYTTFLGD